MLSFYPAMDWFSFFFSWCILRKLIARRDLLLNADVNSVSQEKKQDDLFDLKYLPEEYLSDV